MKLPCDFLSNGICIAGQHDRFADTGRFQQLDCGWSIGLDLVINDDTSSVFPVTGQIDHGADS